MSRPLYEHTQTSWPMRIGFFALTLGLLVLAASPVFGQARPPLGILAAGVGVATLVCWT